MPIQGSMFPEAKGIVEVKKEYASGLLHIEGFSHLMLIYIFHESKGFDQTMCVNCRNWRIRVPLCFLILFALLIEQVQGQVHVERTEPYKTRRRRIGVDASTVSYTNSRHLKKPKKGKTEEKAMTKRSKGKETIKAKQSKKQKEMHSKGKETIIKKKSKSQTPQKCTCPTELTFGMGEQQWDATLLVDLIGVNTEMDPWRLEYYMAQLQESLIVGYGKRCPESEIAIENLITSGQWSTPTDYSGRRGLQSRNSANRVDNKVSVRYRVPPKQPNFSSLTIPE